MGLPSSNLSIRDKGGKEISECDTSLAYTEFQDSQGHTENSVPNPILPLKEKPGWLRTVLSLFA